MIYFALKSSIDLKRTKYLIFTEEKQRKDTSVEIEID